ncbi:MAG: hypothetical protein R2800_06475 [Flavipsychrobacter sp.]
MKIVSEKQLDFIKTEYTQLLKEHTNKYDFDKKQLHLFENLVIFSDDELYKKIRSDHYLSMPECNRTWNNYFWHLSYYTALDKNGFSLSNKELQDNKILDLIHENCNATDIQLIEEFKAFACNFSEQDYVNFDYFHPVITDDGISIYSKELQEIIELLEIKNFSFDEVDNLIENNIDNPNGELLIFSSHLNDETSLKIDTYTNSEDQIHPVDILIRCPYKLQSQVDELLVKWWEHFWNRMGPYVSISLTDKFETNRLYNHRTRIIK